MVSLRALAVNAIVGLVAPFLANVVGLGGEISLLTLLVILLALLDIAFVAAVIPAVVV